MALRVVAAITFWTLFLFFCRIWAESVLNRNSAQCQNMDPLSLDSSCYRDERFRTPLKEETEIGLWVDRIGWGKDNFIGPRRRILGKYCANFVVSGHGELVSASIGKRRLYPGDVIFSFPEEPSAYYPSDHWESKWIVWNGPEACNLEKLGFLNVMEPVMHDPDGVVLEAFGLLSVIENDRSVESILERKTIILNMILKLFRMQRKRKRERERERHYVYNYRVREAVDFLRAHYREPMLMSKLAWQFNLSPSHFRRVFKDYTGNTPKELMTSLRISRAKELLSAGRQIKEVSGLVGYNDVFYFMRLFKKHVKMPPGRFRISQMRL